MKGKENVLVILFFLMFSSFVRSQEKDSTQLDEENIRIGYLWISSNKNVNLVRTTSLDQRENYYNPYFSFQGTTPGVVVSRTDGQEGSNAFTQIRGINSFLLSSQPLIVLNGYPLHDFDISSSGLNLGFGTKGSLDPLRFINQDDIQSIHVLGDIASTSIYGSRGANGVILIETSSPRSKQFTYSSTLSLSTTGSRYDLLNAAEFVSAFDELSTSPASADFGNETNWQDEILRNTINSHHHFRYAKPLKNGFVDTSIGYERYNGLVKATSGEKITSVFAGQYSLFDGKLSLGSSLVGSLTKEDTPPISSTAGARGDLMASALAANPTWSSHPDSAQQIGSLVNPNNLNRYHADLTKSQRIIATFDPSLALTNSTSIALRLGADLSRSERTSAVSRLSNNLNRGVEGNGRAALNDIDQQDLLLELRIEDHRKIGNTSLDVLLGYSDQQFQRDIRYVEAWGFDSTEPDEMLDAVRTVSDNFESSISGEFQQFGLSESLNISGPDNFFVNRTDPVTTQLSTFSNNVPLRSLSANYFTTSTRLKSYFGRVLLDVDSRYGINISSRVDNSNLYSGLEFFGSIGFAWKLHNETFIGEWASKLTLKLGYGNAGNLGANRASSLIFNNQELSRFSNVPVGPGGGIEISSLITQFENDDLTVERSSEWNIATEFAIKGTGLEGQLSLYHRNSNNLTSVGNTPLFTRGLENINGAISNRGVEFKLGYFLPISLLKIRTQAVISYNKNQITQLDRPFNTGQLFGQGVTGTFVQSFRQDFPVYSYYLREFQGYDNNGFQVLGNFEMLNKSALPTTSLGFEVGADYKRITLDLSFYGHFGHYVYNNTKNAFFNTGAIAGARNVIREVIDSDQSIFATNSPSSQFLEKGNFVRCRSIILNYDFEVRRTKLEKLEIFAVLQNPFIRTKYSGLDPEVNVRVGIDYLAYPIARAYSLGVKASF